MSLTGIVNACLAPLGYAVRRIPPSRHTVQGWDWTADVQRLLRGQSVRTIFDVGANKGQTALHLAKRFPRAAIYSFEPFPDVFRQLQQKVQPFPQIRAINSALGESSATRQFFLNAGDETNSLLKKSDTAAVLVPGLMEPRGSIQVPVCALDDFCRQEKIERVDILKLDAQGYELRILDGAQGMLREKKVRIIYSEVQFAHLYEGQAYFHEIYERLLSLGYGMVALYSSAYSPENQLLWADALFCTGPA